MQNNGCVALVGIGLILVLLLSWLKPDRARPPADPFRTSRAPAPSAPSRAAPEWYEGGTLHHADHGEWKRATYANRLATCADAALAMMMKTDPTARPSMDDIRGEAIALEACITEAAKADVDNLRVSETAAFCWILMKR